MACSTMRFRNTSLSNFLVENTFETYLNSILTYIADIIIRNSSPLHPITKNCNFFGCIFGVSRHDGKRLIFCLRVTYLPINVCSCFHHL